MALYTQTRDTDHSNEGMVKNAFAKNFRKIKYFIYRILLSQMTYGLVFISRLSSIQPVSQVFLPDV